MYDVAGTLHRPAHHLFLRSCALKWLPLVTVIVLGIGLRVYRIGARPLWIDETGSYCIAQLPQANLWGPAGKFEYNPPLYYSLQRVWFVFGDSEAALRSLAALFGVLNILLIYGLARTVGGHWAGTIASALLATSSISIRYSQEARAYSMLMAATTLALWGLAYLMKYPKCANVPLIRCKRSGNEASTGNVPLHQSSGMRTHLAWLAYAMGTTVALYCHNTASLLPLLASLIALVMWVRSRDMTRGFVWNWLGVNVIILLLWSWWLPTIFQQFTVDMKGFYITFPTIRYIRKSLVSVYGQTHLPNALRTWITLAVAGLAFFGMWRCRKKPRLILLLLTMVVGVPLLTLAASFYRPIWVIRVLLWPMTAWFTLLAVGIITLPRRWLVITVIVLLLALHLAGVVRYQQVNKPRWDEAISQITNRLQPNDAIIFFPNAAEWPFRYYTRNIDLWDSGARYAAMTAKRPNRLGVFCESRPILTNDVATLLERHKRIWFVVRKGAGVSEETEQDLERIWQDKNLTVESWKFRMIKVVLCETSGP